MTNLVTPALQFELEQLLYREARALDHLRYEEWLDMLSDRLHYWAPVRSNIDSETFEGTNLLALFDDRKADLAMRVKRIRTGFAHAEQPPSRVRRLISNVIVLDADEASVQVASSFIVTVSRWEMPAKIFSGSREDRWIREGDRWLLLDRRIIFDLSTTENISFLL